jgi:nucleotide-binding universal stress UspA family protein
VPAQKTQDQLNALGYERPLVATDGSASSMLALSLAIATASKTAKLIVAAVSPDVEVSEPWVAEAASHVTLQRDVDRELQEKLDDRSRAACYRRLTPRGLHKMHYQA